MEPDHRPDCRINNKDTVEALLSPRGLINFRGPREGPIGEGGLFQTSKLRIYLHGD